MEGAQQGGRERRGGITRLPHDLLKSILQRVVDAYAIFPPALVCRDWNEAIGSLTLSVEADHREPERRGKRRVCKGEDFCNAMVALGKVESAKLDCFRIKKLAAAMGSSGGTRWCAHLKRLKLSEMSTDLCNSSVAGTAFSSVTSASLNPRTFQRFPVWLSQMTSLQRLQLKFFSLRNLSLPSSLQELHLSSSQVPNVGYRVSDTIGDLPHLRILKLISVKGIHLPGSVGSLKHLEELVIKRCQGLYYLPDSLRSLSSLRILRLEGCPDLHYPLLLLKSNTWTRLTTLSMVDCRGLDSHEMSSNSASRWNLPSLERLTMSCCLLRPCPPDLGACQKLTSLDFICGESHSTFPHRVNSLPESLSCLSNLSSINSRRGDCIAELPGFLTSMTQLRAVTVGPMNLFRKRPPGAAPPSEAAIRIQLLHHSSLSGLAHMPCLDTEVKELLQRGMSQLAAMTSFADSCVPCNPDLLPQLECLVLFSCQERTLSPALGAFPNLKTLRIHNCPRLESLPPEIAALQQLKELEIAGCGNLSLPVELTMLQELETLKILGIRDLKSIPTLSAFPKLKRVVIVQSDLE